MLLYTRMSWRVVNCTATASQPSTTSVSSSQIMYTHSCNNLQGFQIKASDLDVDYHIIVFLLADVFFFWERISKVTNSCKRNRCKIQLWDIRYTYICRSIYEFFYLLFRFRLSSSQTLRLDCLDSRKLHNNQLIHFVPIMSNFISNSEKLHI